MNTPSVRLAALVSAVLAFGVAPVEAANVSMSPATATVPVAQGQFSFDLVMDFAPNEATLGGGLDLAVSGAATFASFTPSAWFASAPDPSLSGHGSALSQKDYEVHFGSFNGLSGRNLIGTVVVNLDRSGPAAVDLSINNLVGAFFTAGGAPQEVALQGASLVVTAVPEPATLALFVLGGGLLALRNLRRRG